MIVRQEGGGCCVRDGEEGKNVETGVLLLSRSHQCFVCCVALKHILAYLQCAEVYTAEASL
jgi:hypothetical protein